MLLKEALIVPTQIISSYLQEAPGRRDDMSPDMLIAESNHRIANNLTLIAGMLRLRASDIARAGGGLSAEEASLMLAEVGERIQTVGRLHRLLAQTEVGEDLDLADYLHDVAAAAVDSMSAAGGMLLERGSMSSCKARPREALLIGFIVGELVTNSVKYAHPSGVSGRVRLGCEPRPEGAVLVVVADDGVGLPDGFNPRRDGGLGMRTVRGLADQLGATLTFDSGGVGLTARLLVPPGKPAN